MTSASTAPARRPREVTIAGIQIVLGSAMVLVVAFNGMAQLRSSEMREVLSEVLRSEQAASLNLTMESARTLVKYSLLVSGAAAAVALVLGIFVMRRDRSSRWALTIMGGLIALFSLAGGPAAWLLTMYVAAAVLLLWTKAARAWFAPATAEPTAMSGPLLGQAWPPLPPPPPPDRHAGDGDRESQELRDGPGRGSPPYDGLRSRYDRPSTEADMSYPQYPDQPDQQPPGGQYQGGQYPSGPYQGGAYQGGDYQGGAYQGQYPGGGYDERPAPSRPGTLLAGCILTWIGSALGLLFGLLLLGMSGNQDLAEALDAAGSQDVETIMQVTGSMLALWSLLAAVLAVFTFMGKRWAAIALAVVGALYVALVVFGMVTSGDPTGVVAIAWVVGSLALIFAGSKAWFEHKSGKGVSY